MIAPHIRLQEARRKAGFETASDAARAFGWNENTYRSHENGERGLRPGVVAQYARALKTTSAWLLLGDQGGFEIEQKKREPILIFKDGLVATTNDAGTRFFVDTITLYSNIMSRYLLIYTHEFRPRFEYGDLLIMSSANKDNFASRDSFLAADKDGVYHFGDLIGIETKTYMRTYGNKLIPNHEFAELNVIMAIVRSPFYELTDHA